MRRATGASRWRLVLVCSLALLATGPLTGAAEEPNPALKYHAVLQKRPEPGYLFDRFYNTWLDQSTAESLQAFLQSQVDQADTTANRVLLALFHAKQNDDVAAIDEFAKALKADPTSATTWFHKSLAESRTLDFEAAIADLKQARSQKPDAKLAVQIERQLGAMLLRNHQTNEAIGVWKALLDAHPGDEELCEDVIELHIEEGLFDQAAALAEALIARTKDPYAAVTRRLRLGDIHHRAGRREKAVEVYAATLEQSGHDSWLEREILAQIEQLFRLEDDLSGLKGQYAKLQTAYPKRIGLQRRRCRLLVELGENDEAVKGYRAILELTPGDRACREEYVEMLSRIGRHDAAVKELEALCEQSPKDAELRVRLAKTLQRAKQPDRAIDAVRQYVKVSDGSEYAYLRAARLVESFGDKTRAVPFYRDMAEKFADSPSAQEAHAAFLYANKQKDEALAIWKKLAQAADVNQTLNVARALSARGEEAAAYDVLAARQKDFAQEPLFLGQLVSTALRQKKYKESLPWARRRVELATNVTELEAAVAQAAGACQESDRLDEVIAELAAVEARSVPLTCLLAELLEAAGESARADALLKDPAERGESLAVGQQIRLASTRREWAQAAGATRRLLELSGGRKSLHVRRLVELYERDYQIDEALKWVETWKRLSPGGTIPWLTEARLLRLQGREDDAQEALRKAIQRFDKDEELRVSLAQAYQDSGKTRDAERVYWQLYEKAADVADRLRWAAELAKLAERDGSVTRLADNFEERARRNRRSIVPLLALAEIHRVAGNYEGRRQALLAATKVKPEDLELLTHVARIEEAEGDWKEAVATLQRAAKLDKTNQTRQKIAQLHLEYGDADEGYAMLRELMGEQATDPRSIERMADSLCGMMEWDRAVELLRERIADHPGDYRLRYVLGVAYEESGRPEQATAQFLQLLEGQQELPRSKGQPSPGRNASGSYLDVLRRMIPAETMEWFEIAQSQHTAYMHRQRGQMGVAYATVSGGSTQGAVSVPTSVDAVRPYALAHLFTIARELDEREVAVLASKMKRRGVQSPKLLLKLGFDTNRGMPSVADALEEDPDNESLLAMVVFMGFSQDQGVEAAPLVRAFKRFREKRPELAVMAAIQAAAKDEKHAALVDEAIPLAAAIKDPNPLVMVSLARSLGGQRWMGGDERSALDPKRRAKLVKLLVDWYPKMSQGNTPYGPYAFICVVGALRTGDDPSGYFALLDDEVARSRKTGGRQGGQNPYAMFGRQQTALLQPIRFPPSDLPDFPPNVLMLLGSAESNPYSYMIREAGTPTWDADKVEPLVKKIKDPTLRLLLAHQHDLPKLVDATLKDMLAEKPPRLDAYLTAAGKAGADLRFGEAVRILEKARHLPMKQELRRRIDAGLVAAVLAARDDAKTDESVLKAGRDAALRLRRQRLDQQQREQLVVAMEDLGLKKEARKLEKRSAAASGSPVYSLSPAAAAYAPGRISTAPNRVDKLIASGKRDAAARLLVGEVRSIAQQMLASSGNYGYYRQQGRQLKTRLDGLGMTDEVMKQFEPGEGHSAARLREYALACEVLDRPKEARKAYQRMLAERPKDDLARMRLILLSDKKDAAAIDEHLAKLSDAGGAMLGQSLAGVMNDNEADWDERFGVVEIALRYLARQKDQPRADASWAVQLIESFGRQQYVNRAHSMLPSLYQRKPTDEGHRESDPKALERRAKLHRDFCLQMMELPESARTGFQHLLAAAEARGEVLSDVSRTGNRATPEKTATAEKSAKSKSPKPDDGSTSARDTADDFRRYAEKVVLAEANRRKLPGPATMGVTRYYRSGNSEEVRFRTPEEYLAVAAWRSGDWKHVDDELLPKLAEARDQEPHKSLARLAKLYRCPSEEFLATAKEVVKQAAPSVPYLSQTNDGLAVVIGVWADRSLAVDIEPMLLDSLRRDSRGQGYPAASPMLVRYFETLVARGKKEAASASLEKVATIYLGPAEKRAEFVRKNYQRNSVTWGTPNAQIYTYVNLLDQLAQSESLVFVVLGQAEPLGDALRQGNLSYRVRQCAERMAKRKPEEILAVLESSPWLGDLKEFRVLALGQQPEEWPLVVALRDSNGLTSKRMEPLWKALGDQQKAAPTFGRGLLLAVVAERTQKTALLEYLGKHVEAIRQLPAERQGDLALLVKTLLHPEATSRTNVGPSTQAARAWINEHVSDRSKQFLDKLGKAKRLEDLGVQGGGYWELGQYLSEFLPALVRDDPAAARKAFFQVVKLAEDAQRRGQMHYYSNEGNSLAGQILEYSLQRRGPDLKPEMLVFLVDVLGSPEGKQISASSFLRHAMEYTVAQRYSRAQRDGKKTLPPEKAVARFHEDLGKMLGDRPCTVLVPALSAAMEQRVKKAEDYAKVADWAKREMTGGKHPAMAADLWACARLGQARVERSKQPKSAAATPGRLEPADYHEHFRNRLTDEKSPMAGRLAVASFVVDAEGASRVPAALARDAAAVYVAAMEGDVAVSDAHHRALLAAVSSIREEPASKELIGRWGKAFERRYLRGSAAGRAVGPYTSYAQAGNSTGSIGDVTTLTAALGLYLSVDDVERVNMLLRKYESTLAQSPTGLAQLVRFGKADLAARLFTNHWSTLGFQWPGGPTDCYKKEIEENTPAFLSKIPRDDQKLLAQIVLATMPSPKGSTARDDRLITLARRLKETKFPDKAVKTRAVLGLITSDRAAEPLADEVAEEYKGFDIAQIAVNNDFQRVEAMRPVVRQHVINRLRANDVQPFVETLKKLATPQNNAEYLFDRLGMAVLGPGFDAIRGTDVRWTPDQSKQAADALRGVMKNRRHAYFNNVQAYTSLLLVSHVQAGQPDELVKWFRGLPAEVRPRLSDVGVSPRVWDVLAKAPGKPAKENLEQRTRLVRDAIHVSVKNQWLVWHAQRRNRMRADKTLVFARVVKAGLMTPEELIERGPAMVEKLDDGGLAKSALAAWLHENKEHEKAVAQWRAAIAAAPRKDGPHVSYWQWDLARSLDAMGRRDEARNAAAAVNVKRLDRNHKPAFEKFRSSLAKTVAGA